VIKWDELKNLELIIKRRVSFEKIAEIIMNDGYIDILAHPKKENQYIFIIELKEYIWVVPFVVEGDTIFLKTAFPSRKFNNIYRRGAKKDESFKK
jgi:uncharacterized DUF497 family protein